MGSTAKETKKSKRERTKYTQEQEEIGDEYHYILESPFFENQRLHIKQHQRRRPNILTFTNNMASKDKNKLFKLCKLIVELEILERVFATTHYPDSIEMDDLADELEISNEKVSIWFQNRRSKFKRQSKDSQVTWMRNQVYNQENRPNLLTIPRGPEIKRFPVPNVTMDMNRHVLSTAPTKTTATPDSNTPSSNLHYRPTPNAGTSSPLPWELNFRYTTPSPPYDLPSCAREILKDSNVNPSTARPDCTNEQFYGQTSPPNFWTNYSINPTRGMVPIRATNMMPQFPMFSPLDLTNQQFTAL